MLSGKALVEYVRVSTQEFLSLFFQTLPLVFPSGIFRSDWRPESLQGCKRKKVFSPRMWARGKELRIDLFLTSEVFRRWHSTTCLFFRFSSFVKFTNKNDGTLATNAAFFLFH